MYASFWTFSFVLKIIPNMIYINNPNLLKRTKPKGNWIKGFTRSKFFLITGPPLPRMIIRDLSTNQILSGKNKI